MANSEYETEYETEIEFVFVYENCLEKRVKLSEKTNYFLKRKKHTEINKSISNTNQKKTDWCFLFYVIRIQ